MIVVDSVTIAIKRELVDVIDTYFSHTTAPDGSLVKMIAKPDCMGLNTIEVKPDIVRFTISAKILLDQYKLGISINTIDRVLDVINKAGIIKLRTNALDSYSVHKCDFVSNFPTTEPIDKYFTALNIIHNPYYRNNMYERSCKTGFAFIGKQGNNNKYMKFYDKSKELPNSQNYIFTNLVDLPKLLNDFKDIIRIEFRALTYEQIRSYAEITDNRLSSLLLSSGKPLSKIFCEILRGNIIKPNDVGLITNITTAQGIDNALKYLGYSSWLHIFDNDLERGLYPIQKALKSTEKHKSNACRKLKLYKSSLQRVLGKELMANNMDKYINEIKRFLLDN